MLSLLRPLTSARSVNNSRRAPCKPRLERLEDRTVPSWVNIAYNPAGSDLPSSLESDRGWGGGSYPWDMLDGITQHNDTWAHGLAFTGGRLDYVEPAGPRQATINFGKEMTFQMVVLWHHGDDHIPADTGLQYWDGSAWNDIASDRYLDLEFVIPPGHWGSKPDYYFFDEVTASKVRYNFDNRLNNVFGAQIEHGWLYEFEVYQDDGRGRSPGSPPVSPLPLSADLVTALSPVASLLQARPVDSWAHDTLFRAIVPQPAPVPSPTSVPAKPEYALSDFFPQPVTIRGGSPTALDAGLAQSVNELFTSI